MSKKKKVSVVITTRNTPLIVLKKCITSVKEQTYQPLEILLLDANDTSSPYKKALQNDKELTKDILYLEHAERNEYVNGKNLAFTKLKGHYVLFISAQDLMPPKRIAKCVQFLENHPECHVLATDSNLQPDNIIEREDLSLTTSTLSYLSQIIFRNFCFDFVEGFDPYLTAHADDDFLFKLYQTQKIMHLSNKETTIFVNPACYHHFSDLQSAIGYRQILTKYMTYFQEHKQLKKKLLQAVSQSYKKAHLTFRFIQFAIKSKMTAPFSDKLRKSKYTKKKKNRHKA